MVRLLSPTEGRTYTNGTVQIRFSYMGKGIKGVRKQPICTYYLDGHMSHIEPDQSDYTYNDSRPVTRHFSLNLSEGDHYISVVVLIWCNSTPVTGWNNRVGRWETNYREDHIDGSLQTEKPVSNAFGIIEVLAVVAVALALVASLIAVRLRKRRSLAEGTV